MTPSPHTDTYVIGNNEILIFSVFSVYEFDLFYQQMMNRNLHYFVPPSPFL